MDIRTIRVYKKFVDIYQHSPVVRAKLDEFYGKLYQPGWSQ